jgi:hypothetical protein
MAEMDTSGGGGKHKKGPGVKKGKKMSTRVDLTPMVDLGFLLITFFIFTTTMSQPTAMQLNLPDDSATPEEQNKAKESGALQFCSEKIIMYFFMKAFLHRRVQILSLQTLKRSGMNSFARKKIQIPLIW